MADILVRNVDDAVVEALKERARLSGTSMNDIARDALGSFVRPSRESIVSEARAIRAAGRFYSGDSTALIREDRDNDEPYR